MKQNEKQENQTPAPSRTAYHLLWLLGMPLFAGIPPIVLTLITKNTLPFGYEVVNVWPRLIGIGYWLPFWFIWSIANMSINDPVKRGSGVLVLVSVVVSMIVCINIYD